MKIENFKLILENLFLIYSSILWCNCYSMETYNNRFGKRIISNLIEPPCSKKQKTTSLLKLCENEEWDFIIEFAQDMIQVWDVEVQVFKNPLHVCSSKGALKVMQHLLKLKMFKPEDLGQKNRF